MNLAQANACFPAEAQGEDRPMHRLKVELQAREVPGAPAYFLLGAGAGGATGFSSSGRTVTKRRRP